MTDVSGYNKSLTGKSKNQDEKREVINKMDNYLYLIAAMTF
jgi:hypothetical protein